MHQGFTIQTKGCKRIYKNRIEIKKLKMHFLSVGFFGMYEK